MHYCSVHVQSVIKDHLTDDGVVSIARAALKQHGAGRSLGMLHCLQSLDLAVLAKPARASTASQLAHAPTARMACVATLATGDPLSHATTGPTGSRAAQNVIVASAALKDNNFTHKCIRILLGIRTQNSAYCRGYRYIKSSEPPLNSSSSSSVFDSPRFKRRRRLALRLPRVGRI